MNILKDKKEKRGQLHKELDELTQKISDGTITKEERTRLSAAEAEFDQLNSDITSLENAERRGKQMPISTEISNTEKREMGNFSISRVIKAQVEGRAIDGLEKELIDESMKEARALGASPKGIYLSNAVLNATHEKRTMTVGTLADGGYFVPTEKLGFFDALYAKTVLENLGVTKLTGLMANTDLPGFTTGVTSGWAAETGTQTASTPVVANRTLRPKLLYSAVDISRQLAIQTNNSVDNYVMMSIIKSMAATLEAAVINGDGSNKPTGILGTSGIQDVAMGTNGAAPTLAKILALVSAVENANANVDGAKFLINPKTVAKLKQTVIDSGSGAMILAYNQYFGGIQNVIDGYPTFSTTNVPSNLTKGSSTGVCSAIIFGDFSQVVVGQFGGVDMVIDTTSAAVVRGGIGAAITVNQYVDSAIQQPAALGAILDVLTT